MWNLDVEWCWHTSRRVICRLWVLPFCSCQTPGLPGKRLKRLTKKTAWSGQLPATAKPELGGMKQGREVVGNGKAWCFQKKARSV
jgi:hypothetical protein